MMNRYSLWVMPVGWLHEKLDNLISQISEKHHSPVFKPHVTLLGSVAGDKDSIILETSKLASSIEPYDIHLTNVSCLDEYFRSLFIEVEKTDEVMRANLEARRSFVNDDDSVYFPHLSLMYGKFPTKIKKEIISEIGDRFNLTFRTDSIHLFDTSGRPEEWHHLEKFPLGEK